jgi:hypothetical protein
VEAACVRIAKDAYAAAAAGPVAGTAASSSSLGRRRGPSDPPKTPPPSSPRAAATAASSPPRLTSSLLLRRGNTPGSPQRPQPRGALPSSSLARESTTQQWRQDQEATAAVAATAAGCGPIPLEQFITRVQACLSGHHHAWAWACTRDEVLAAVARLVEKGFLRHVVEASGPSLYQLCVAYVPASSSASATGVLRQPRQAPKQKQGEAPKQKQGEEEGGNAAAAAAAAAMVAVAAGACRAMETQGEGGTALVGHSRGEQLAFALALVRRRVAALAAALHTDGATVFALLERRGWDVGAVVGSFFAQEGDDPLAALLAANHLPTPTLVQGGEGEHEGRRGARVLAAASEEEEEGKEGDICPCCFTERVALRLVRCGHGACKGCLARMVVADMEEGKVPLTCLALVDEDMAGSAAAAAAAGGEGGAGGGRRGGPRMHRCPSALTPAALGQAGLGQGEVLVWGFEAGKGENAAVTAARVKQRLAVWVRRAPPELVALLGWVDEDEEEEEEEDSWLEMGIGAGVLGFAVSGPISMGCRFATGQRRV